MLSSTDAVDYVARHESFERWFQTPLGRALLADQRRCIDAGLQHRTGARQLHVGISHRLPLATGADFSHKVMTTPRWCSQIPEGVAVCDADELAFPGDAMDLVVLHHTADFSPFPHQVIREAERVLRGEGTLVLIGFNPLSLWGARKLISRHKDGPWGGRFLLRGRMEDWLRLLNFNIETSTTRFFRAPLQRSGRTLVSRIDDRLSGNRFLPVGAYYCIVAKKRVHSRLPRRPVWRQRRVMGLQGPKTVGASRGCSRNGSPPSRLT